MVRGLLLANWRLLRDFYVKLHGRLGTEVFPWSAGRSLRNCDFFCWRQAAKKQKMARVLIKFSGVSLHGE
jgi:hypothetical protein